MSYLLTFIVNIILAIGTLLSIACIILIHELGHYLAARLNKLYAHSVSIGFGKCLLSYTDTHNTTWQLRALPLGGYVDLIGSECNKKTQWTNLHYLQKSSIILAGITSNLILAWLLLTITTSIGFEQRSSIVAKVYPNTPAAEMSLLPGDKIVKINHTPVANIEQTMLTIAMAHNHYDRFSITVLRQGQERILHTHNHWQLIQEKRSITRNFGISFQRDYTPATLTHVAKYSAAEQAGLRRYDKIISINDRPVYTAHDVTDYLRDHPKQPLTLTILRQQQKITITINKNHNAIKTLRFQPPTKQTAEYFIYQEPLTKASYSSLHLIYQHLYLQTNILFQIVIGKLSIHILSGPVEILQLSFMLSHSVAFMLWLRWLAAINISLAFINLLPLPILDGGQWLITTLTALTGRAPSSELIEAINYLSIFIIAFVVSVITYFELLNILIS